MDPFSCEIGDWSSKYGVVDVDSDTYIASGGGESFYEVIPNDIEGMSVVFHCTTSGGERAFCAVFEDAGEHNDEIPNQSAGSAVGAYFGGVLGRGSRILFEEDGTVDIQLNDKWNLADDYSCSEFEYTIWTVSDTGFDG